MYNYVYYLSPLSSNQWIPFVLQNILFLHCGNFNDIFVIYYLSLNFMFGKENLLHFCCQKFSNIPLATENYKKKGKANMMLKYQASITVNTQIKWILYISRALGFVSISLFLIFLFHSLGLFIKIQYFGNIDAPFLSLFRLFLC